MVRFIQLLIERLFLPKSPISMSVLKVGFLLFSFVFFSAAVKADISCAQKAVTGVGKHPGFSCNSWQGSGWAEVSRDISPTDPDVFSATCARVSSCTCPTGSDLTSHTDEFGAAYADCATNSGEGDGQGDTQTSSSVPACDGDPDTIEICQGSDNSSSDSGDNSSEPSSSGSGSDSSSGSGSGSSNGSGSDSSNGSGSGSSTGSGDNGSGDIPDENSSTGNPGSGDEGGDQGGGGGGLPTGGDGGISGSSSSQTQDCLPGYHYYPNTYTCVPDESSSSTGFIVSSSSSFSSSPSSSSMSSSSSPSSSSQASQNFSSSSSWFVDHNGETPIDESDPCPNKYQDNQGQWWCINNNGANSSGAASSSGGAAAANCKAEPSCDGDPVQCAILKQVWINLCDGVDKATPVDSDGDIKAMDDEFDRLINSEQLQLDEDGTLSSIKHTRIDLSKKEFGLDQLDVIANEGTSAQCPQPININLSLGTFEVSFQPLCELADQLHYLVVFIFSYIAAVIIYRAIERA